MNKTRSKICKLMKREREKEKVMKNNQVKRWFLCRWEIQSHCRRAKDDGVLGVVVVICWWRHKWFWSILNWDENECKRKIEWTGRPSSEWWSGTPIANREDKRKEAEVLKTIILIHFNLKPQKKKRCENDFTRCHTIYSIFRRMSHQKETA